jgi:drug/metabolite transporter (DMT)-like permease/cytidylate kinase
MNLKNGSIYIVLTAMAFGTMEISLKIAGSAFTAFQLTFLRFLIGGLLLLPLALREQKKRNIHVGLSDIIYLAVLGIINVVFSMVLFQVGVNLSNAGIAAIVFSCNPIFTMIFSYFIVHDPFTRQKAITALLSLVGLLIVADPRAIITHGSIGLLIVLLAGIGFALYTTLGKLRIQKLGGSTMNSYSFLLGALGLLFVLFYTGDPIFSGINSHSVWPLIYTSVVVTGFGYVCYMKAIELCGPGTASFAFFLKPVIALILAFFILGEPITLRAVLGLVLIITGCTLAGPIERMLFGKKKAAPVSAAIPVAETGSYPLVITVSREFGSGGRAIAKQLSRLLGIPFYDTEIIRLASQEDHLPASFVKDADQSINNRFIYGLFAKYAEMASGHLPGNDELFRAESEVIRELAAKGSCVIVGRLANVVLKDRPNTFHVFISSDPKWAAQRIMLREHVNEEEALSMAAKINQRRREHCRYYTDTFWGYGGNYDLTIKSSSYGIVESARLIVEAVKNELSIKKAPQA